MSSLLWVLLEISCHGLFMGLLILAFFTAILLLPYLLGLVLIHYNAAGLPLTMMCLSTIITGDKLILVLLYTP